jgi:putative glutamine amidotransferase
MFPLAPIDALPALLDLVDGVLLTGSSSNVHPSHFGQTIDDPSLPLDPERDALTLALVRGCVERGVPLLGICRGFQEINVALGGSLHQTVQAVHGLLDHRETGATPEQQYALSHEIRLAPGSALEHWACGPVAHVNSLHGQGVDRLAPGLRATAHAPDGLIEAFELASAPSFVCAVQWHPEWRCQENPFYAAILGAFGDAARARRVHRLSTSRMNFS